MPRSYSHPITREPARNPERREADAAAMAELVADGASIYAAGNALNLTRGEASSTWRRICTALGSQAA